MIGENSATLIIAFVVMLIAAAFLLENSRVGKFLSGSVLVMLIAITASNVGITPTQSPVYDIILGQLVPVGISLLLLNARLKVVLVEAKPVLLSFAIACLATLAGTAAAVALMNLGPIEAQAAGIFAATYIGGAMNFVAVSQSVQFTDPDMYAGALAADTVIGAAFFMVLMVISNFLAKPEAAAGAAETTIAEPEQPVAEQNFGWLALIIGGAFLVSWLSQALSVWLGMEGFSILFLTVITVAVANVFPEAIARVRGVERAGVAVMYAFFIAVGFGADLSSLAGSAVPFLFFASIILIVHLLIVTSCAFLFRMPMREMLVASNAAVLGPATAAGMAGARGWSDLVTPGLFAGILGYVIANFIGVGVAMLLGWSA